MIQRNIDNMSENGDAPCEACLAGDSGAAGAAPARRIGVFICHCGGNISDYVDVEAVRQGAEALDGVAVARTHVFACSDSAQQEMIEDIRSHQLDGLVIASCSPMLHVHTFRRMARQAGLNPYRYVHVNLREQCSWAHREDGEAATAKGIALVRAGVAKAALSRGLEPLRVETAPRVLVLGAGAAGLRAAVALADMGLGVYLVEKAPQVGGWTVRWRNTFPAGRSGRELVERLIEQVRARPSITLFTEAELIDKSGSVGDFTARIRVGADQTITLQVGAIVVCTGFDTYQPANGEFGFGLDGVLTLSEFKDLVDGSQGELTWRGRPVGTVAYIYCVGSRQEDGREGAHRYCSRYCCTSAVHTALTAHGRAAAINQYHFFRDMRTYGKNEVFYEQACRAGSVFVRYDPGDPPVVEQAGGALRVRARDLLLGGEEIELDADLVVLVTGMVPRTDAVLAETLKLPVSPDGFFNEIHLKLRPVETVIDGVFIAGACQGPKTLAESVASALAAVAKTGAMLMKGYVELEPLVARVNAAACDGCGQCVATCPYGAIEMEQAGDDRQVAHVAAARCKGEGGCVSLCPRGALDVEGCTHAQVCAMIEALAGDTEPAKEVVT